MNDSTKEYDETPAQDPQITLTRTREAPFLIRAWAWFLALSTLKFTLLWLLMTYLMVFSLVASNGLFVIIYVPYLVLASRAMLWR